MRLLIVLLLAISCSSNKKELITINGETMGTYYRIKLYSSEDSVKIKKSVDKFLVLFNNIFSTYIPDSEISRINKSKFDKSKLSKSLNKLMALSLEISKQSRGYFDPTVGPLVNAWGFGPDGKAKKPTTEEIEELKGRIGYQLLKLKDNWLRKEVGNMYIDLSAVAKGYGVDELVQFLEYQGYTNLLVEIGGEVRTRGKKASGDLWRVGIEGPSNGLGSKIAKVVSLNNMSMATSGSYRNFLKYGDEIFNHTIDVKSGRPVNHKTISVSVIHEYCTDADAWATAFMGMGAKKALKLADELSIGAFIQYKEAGKIKKIMTKTFKEYITTNK